MLASRRLQRHSTNGTAPALRGGSVIGRICVLAGSLACALMTAPVSAQPAGATPAKEPAPIAPVAPIAATPAPPAPVSEPVPALKPTAPSTPSAQPPSAQPASAQPPSTAPTAVPAAASAPEQKPSPSEPPAAPPPEASPTSAPSTAAGSADAEIELGDVTPSEPGADDDYSELPWKASIEWGQSYNAGGLTRGAEQTFDPQYVWDFILALGYGFDELTALSLKQPLTVELTDSDTTNSRQELWVLDTTLDLTRRLWQHEPAPGDALALSGGVGLVLPISPKSQAAHVIIGTRAKIGFDYEKKHVMHGLSLGAGLGYLRRWATSNVVHIEDSAPCIVGSDDISQSCTHLGGASTTRDLIKLDISGELKPLDKLAVNASFSLGWNLAHGLADASVPISTGTRVQLEDDSTTHFRNTREITIGVGYEFTDWFSAEVNAVNGFSERGPDGDLRGPFHAIDIALGLNLTLSIDQLYLAQRGGAAGSD